MPKITLKPLRAHEVHLVVFSHLDPAQFDWATLLGCQEDAIMVLSSTPATGVECPKCNKHFAPMPDDKGRVECPFCPAFWNPVPVEG